MKPIDIKEHFGTWTAAMRELNFSNNLYRQWVNKGYVPMYTQLYIEKVTRGYLQADREDLPKNLQRKYYCD